MPEPLEQNLDLSLSPLWRDVAIWVFFTRTLPPSVMGKTNFTLLPPFLGLSLIRYGKFWGKTNAPSGRVFERFDYFCC
jgi:hypothetical protein